MLPCIHSAAVLDGFHLHAHCDALQLDSERVKEQEELYEGSRERYAFLCYLTVRFGFQCHPDSTLQQWTDDFKGSHERRSAIHHVLPSDARSPLPHIATLWARLFNSKRMPIR
jgi:hypothetical protein